MIKENEEIKKIAIYTRVSTEDQARDGFSLDSQMDRLRSYCKAREWEIIAEYVDAWFSGRNTRRPQYMKMLEHSLQNSNIFKQPVALKQYYQCCVR